MGKSLEAVDWMVIAAYGVVVLAIGRYFSKRTSTSDDYLLGGRTMKSWTVGLSLFATLLSAISYLAWPGEMIRYGPMFVGAIIAYPFVVVIATRYTIPALMKLRVTSAYEILENRFGLSVRLLGSLFFLSLRLIWMAVIIYTTTSKVLIPMLGWDEDLAPIVCAVLGAITVAYTTMGGLRAVVFTDVLQTFILFGGAVLALVVITVDLGGVGEWWPSAWQDHWEKPTLGYDPDARRSFFGFILATFTWHFCTSMSDQMAIQRYLATRDVKAARRTLMISMSADAVVLCFVGLLGLALLAYFQARPDMVPEGASVAGDGADRLLPHFIVTGLPAGISGLVVSALLAAAMSSLSSGVNSCCTVVSVDFLERFRPRSTDEAGRVRRMKVVAAFVGGVVILIACFVGMIEANLLEVTHKTVNLLVAPLAGLFFMALFVPWATSFGTLVGAAAGVTVVILINYWEPIFGTKGISFLWGMPLGLVAQVSAGMLFSLVKRSRP